MLRVSVHKAVIFCLLEAMLCLDDGSASEATSVLECFTIKVDIPWQFSDEEGHRVEFFKHATDDKCDKSVWRIFECNYPLMKRLQQAENLQASSLEKEYEYHKTKNFEHFESALQLQSQATDALNNLILLIQNIKLLADVRNETRILNDNCSRQFLDIDNLKNTSITSAEEYATLQTHLEIFRIINDTLWYYMPPFIIIVFICGMIGNGVLLLIFVRHPETRVGPNAMLVNLAISDALFLFCNVALDYCKKLWTFPLGVAACYFYTFFLTLITGGSVYSMTMLSLSRYLAVTATPGKRSNLRFISTPVMLTLIWIMSSIVAIPDTLSIVTTEGVGYCGASNRLLNALWDFFFISLLPLITITCFYIIASKRLTESARNMPGEAAGQVKVKTARERGARILPALAFVFAITYLPFYTLWAVITVFRIETSSSPVSHRLFFTSYFLFNLNSTLNPVALYAASSMFRKYFNKYLCLGLVKKETVTETQNKTQVVTADPVCCSK